MLSRNNKFMTPFIRLRSLEKSFPTRPTPTWVLRQIDLDVGG